MFNLIRKLAASIAVIQYVACSPRWSHRGIELIKKSFTDEFTAEEAAELSRLTHGKF